MMIDQIPPQDNRKRGVIIWLLVLILLVGAALRLYNLRWDLGTFPHPDERSTLLFYAPTIRLPEDLSQVLDPRASTLNPFWEVQRQERRSYTYGHFPLYLLVLTSAFLQQLTPLAVNLHAPEAVINFLRDAPTGLGYAVVGRALVGLLDVLSIYLVFLIARRLYGDWAGLLAAALSAFAVFHIQLAHFFAVDPISTTFVLLTVYGSLLMLDRRTTAAAILTGVAVGLAVSSKYSAVPIGLVPALASLYIASSGNSTAEKSGGWSVAFRLLLTVAAVSFLIFAVTSPFVLLDFENFRRAVADEQGNMVSGVADFPFTRQYRNTWPYLYFIEQQVRWGLWWPLGLLAFGGFAWALLRGIAAKTEPGEGLMLAWLVPYFGINGLFLAKFMRYMSPVTPLIIILGVGLLVAFSRWFGRRYGPLLGQNLGGAIGGVVLLGTIFWAALFVNGVYGTENSWVTTSRWIYANVPDGACIAREHWEESVPRDWGWLEPGMSPGQHSYYQPELPMYDPDNQAKYERLRDTLRQCDYVVIASNRMYRTLPRLEQRYPMSTRYYQLLFNGQLGYDLVYEHGTPPSLGPFTLDDQAADESFTVYDHPKAFVFKKVRDLTDEQWFQALGDSWQGAIDGYIGKPTLMMRLRGVKSTPGFENQAQQANTDAKAGTWLKNPLDGWPLVDDWKWNGLAEQNMAVAILSWWLAMQLIGLVTFPIVFLLFSRLADRGYLLSKSVGLLLVSYGAWLLAGLGFPANRLIVILGWLLILAAVSTGLARSHWAALRAWWHQQWKLVLIGEAIFALVFFFFVYLRALNPDLWQPWQGGEKMLEIGFFNAIVKSAYVPPYDPFFAGTRINYYYYGIYLAGILVKLTGIRPTMAFNLAVPMLAGLTAINVFSLAGNLVRREAGRSLVRVVVTGLLGVLFVLFFSNLDGMGQFMRNLAEISHSNFTSAVPGLQTLVRSLIGFGAALQGTPIREYNFWDPSRVIPFTINEFPYWSFLFADFHPHMIGIPFTVLFLSLTYTLLKTGDQAAQTPQPTSSEPVYPTNPPVEAVVGPGTFAFELMDSAAGDAAYPPAAFPAPHSTFWEEVRALLVTEFESFRQLGPGSAWRWLALPFVLGALAAINTWDLPTYLGLTCAAFALARYRAGLRPVSLARSLVLLVEMGLFSVVLLMATLLLYRPFFANYSAPEEVGLGLIKDKIPFDEFFKLWGFFLLIVLTWLAVEIRRPSSRFAPLRAAALFIKRWNVLPHLLEHYRLLVAEATGGYKLMLGGVVWLMALAVLLLLFKYLVVALLIPWAILALLLLLRWDVLPERSFVGLLTFTCLLVLLGIQFVFLKDFLGGGDYYRMNTYFKFFIQVWVMIGIAAAVVLPEIWERSDRWPLSRRIIWQGVVVLLTFSSLVYFVLGTRTRLDSRFPGARPTEPTLDGLAYMTVGQYNWNGVDFDLKYDYEAIRWLTDNVPGTPVIAEAKIGYYREGGMRIAAYTGLPSPLGDLHQGEQHPPNEMGQRDGLVRQFWNETDPIRTYDLARELNIQYIYLGQLERVVHGQHQGEKFDNLVRQGLAKVAFENEKTKIYRLVSPGDSE